MLRTQTSRTQRRSSTAVMRAPARLPAPDRRVAVIPRSSATAVRTTRRPLILLIVMLLMGAGLASRLVFWQVLQHAHLLRAAQEQRDYLFNVPALRGQIFDSSGTLLAANGTYDVVFATQPEIKNTYRTSALLAPLLHVRQIDLERNLYGDAKYVVLAQHVSKRVSDRISQLALPGIYLSAQPVRMYPGNSAASQIIGFVGGDDRGQYGIEAQYDRWLSGKAGVRSMLTDTSGATVRVSNGPNVSSQNGADVTLSLNSMIQSAAESELNAAVKKHHADGGTLIVMDPRTGYILGLANSPSYNPNHYAKYADSGRFSLFANPATQSVYEPGSTFKIITMAAGIDTHVVTPQTSFYDSGTWMVGATALHNWNKLGNGEETMTQVFQHSANVGASFVASKVGPTKFYNYVRKFGIGRRSGVDLPDEASGTVWHPGQKQWSDVMFYTNSFGQGLSTTPLQMIHAVAAVANRGIMMKPQLMRSIVYRGKMVQTHPVSQGPVISPETAATETHMLVQSAIGGEASLGLVKGYDIAAKTGTSNVPSPRGGYIVGDTVASIVGYAPAYNPRFVVLVKIDHPRDTPWGSMAAAPVLHNMFQDLFMFAHIAPSPHALYR